MHLDIRTLMKTLDAIAPFDDQEDWDNSGLMIGQADALCTGVYLDLDLTADSVAAALKLGVNTILTHHPILFAPLRSLNTAMPPGETIRQAVLAGMNVIAMHTNLDKSPGGVSDVLAEKLGLLSHASFPGGIGRIASSEEKPAAYWLERVAEVLHTKPGYIGETDKPVRTVGVCGGACGELIESAGAYGLDLLITSEIKHHQALFAKQTGLFVIDAGHYASEYPVLEALASRLRETIACPVFVAGFAPPIQMFTGGDA